MHRIGAVILVLPTGVPVMAEGVSFSSDTIGSPPKGWTLTMTGQGTPRWNVEQDDTISSKELVLKQSGKATYPIALKEGTHIKDASQQLVQLECVQTVYFAKSSPR
jgi:hypothetical protein